MKRPRIFSQRLLRKGPFVEETFRLFAGWVNGDSVPQNLKRAFHGQFNTLGWEREVSVTTSGRLKNIGALRPLITLAQNGMEYRDWRDCWRLWIGATEEPFGTFALDWLFTEFASGRYQFRSEDVRAFATTTWTAHSPAKPLSEYGVMRAARDLLRTASDLGMLVGDGPAKSFATISMSDSVVLFYAHMIAEMEGSTTKVPTSPLWRLAYMAPPDVHAALLNLHQFRRLDYQVAGSLVQLALPHPSPAAFAENLAA